MQQAASLLRDDAGAIGDVAIAASNAAQEAARSSGAGPLTAALYDLAGAIDRAGDGIKRGLLESADALEVSATDYLGADRSAVGGFGGVLAPPSHEPP